MARDARIEARLQRWAAWVSVGDGSGYPVMSVLHPAWQPPSPGVTPTMKTTAASDAPATHRIIGRMHHKLRDSLVLHYVIKVSRAEHARRIGRTEVAVDARINRAHQALQSELCNILEVV